MVTSSTRLRRDVLRYVAVTAAALLIVAVYGSILQVNETTSALTFLVLVELVAVRWGLAYSVYLSILSSLLYDFYFLPPIHTFTVGDPRNLAALVAFLASAIFISRLSEQARRHAEVSENRRREIERLYQFSQQLLMEEDLHDLARNCTRIVVASFDFENVAVYLAEGDALYFFDSHNEFVSLSRMRVVAQAPDAPGILEHRVRMVPLTLGMRSRGSVAMIEGHYSESLYVAVAGLLAIAFARAAALERFSRVEAAREGERLRNTLLDSLTHELRTPLTGIRAAATSLISQPLLSAEQRSELYSIVDEESARLDRLIGQAVELAQLDTAGIQLRLKMQSLQEIVDHALEDSRALLRNREVAIDIPDNLPPIAMDEGLIRRILRHLLENAAKYSPPGTPIAVSAKVMDERLTVSIRDEGQGIDEEEQSLIFDKFYRGSRQRQQLQGTGMGLAIAKSILRIHHGGIDVISHPNQGAIFTFWIPLAHSEIIPDGTE